MGERYGRLVITNSRVKIPGKDRHCEVRCDCGTVKIIRYFNFRQGNTKSCGCHRRELAKLNSLKIRRLPDGHAAAHMVYNVYAKDARRRNLAFQLSFDEFLILTSQNCAYCGGEPANYRKHGITNGGFAFGGIDRIDSNLGYITGNMNPCCRVCNRAKSNLSWDDWSAWVKRLAENFHG